MKDKENLPTTASESSSDEESVEEEATMAPPKLPTRTSERQQQKNKGNSNKKNSNSSSNDTSERSKYQARIKELEQQLAQRNKEALTPVHVLRGKMTSKDRQQQINKEMSKMVANYATKELWRTTKFIKNEAHLVEKTNQIIKLIELKEHQTAGLEGQELANAEAERNNFNILYRDDVRMEINGKRNYTQVRYFVSNMS